MMLYLITAAGVIVRLLMFLSQKSFWGDEWFSINLVQSPFNNVFWGAINDVHPPLYFLLLHSMVKLFGPYEWIFRFISFSASIGTIFATYFLAKELFGRKTAVFTALLISVSPYYLQLSNEVRSYSLFGFIATLASLFFVKYVKNLDSKRLKYFYFVFALLTIYTEHYGWIWLCSIIAVSLYLLVRNWNTCKSIIMTQVSVIILGLPSLGLIVFQALYKENALAAGRVSAYYTIELLVKKLVAVYWRFSSGPMYSMLTAEKILHFIKTSPSFWISFTVAGYAFILFICSLFNLFRSKRDWFVLCFSMTVLSVLFLLIIYPIRLDARYLSFAAPFFFILLARQLTEWRKSFPLAFLFLFLSHSFISDARMIQLRTDAIHKEDYGGLFQYVFEKAGVNDAIVGLAFAMAYYQNKISPPPKATYYGNLDEFLTQTSRTYDQVWVLDYLDMDEKINELCLTELKQKMSARSYRTIDDMKRFGGKDGLTAFYLFKKTDLPKHDAN